MGKRIPGVLAALTFCVCTAAAQNYKVGDRVDAYDVGWNPGAVTQLGSGNYQGYFLVKYDQFTTERWFKPENLRPGKAPEAPKTYPARQVGEHVEAYEFGWQPGRVTEVGTGSHQGSYLIQYDKFSSQRWFKAQDVREFGVEAAEKARDAAAAGAGPRAGKYNIYSYGAVGAQPLYLGHVELLAGGHYRVSRTSQGNYYGEGEYGFDGASSRIVWKSGPFATPEWGGAFSVNGATHRIGLRSRTVATNTPQ